MLIYTLLGMVQIVFNAIWWIVMAQFVLGLLIAFNVVDTRNDAVLRFYRGLSSLLEPVLGPIRRSLPRADGGDFSPLVLLLGMQLVMYLLSVLAHQGY